MLDGGVVLVAAGGLAREACAALRAASGAGSVVVLDDDPARVGSSIGGAPVVGGLDDVGRYDDHSVVVCAGKGSVRRRIVDRLAALGIGEDRYRTVVHPQAAVADGCPVGAGSILLAGVVLTADVTVGRHVVVMPQATLTHDVVLDDYATLAAGVSLGGSVHVGAAAYLGMNASVREGLRVGADAILGMGSVLLHDVPAGQTWAGVPARDLATGAAGQGG